MQRLHICLDQKSRQVLLWLLARRYNYLLNMAIARMQILLHSITLTVTLHPITLMPPSTLTSTHHIHAYPTTHDHSRSLTTLRPTPSHSSPLNHTHVHSPWNDRIIRISYISLGTVAIVIAWSTRCLTPDFASGLKPRPGACHRLYINFSVGFPPETSRNFSTTSLMSTPPHLSTMPHSRVDGRIGNILYQYGHL